MSTSLHVLLKADPRLEGDVEVTNLIFWGAINHQHVLRLAVFVESSCHSGCTVLANREGWRVEGDLVPQEAPDNL